MTLFFVFSCNMTGENQTSSPISINFENENNTDSLHLHTQNDSVVTVAIAAIISPTETYVYYKDLLDYISKKIHVQIVYKQKKTYAEINNLVMRNQVDLAFICSGSYILMDTSKVDILAVPVSNGKPYYQAYIITNIHSGINNFSELRDKSFAFTDPQSNTGYNYVKRYIDSEGGNINDYFSKTLFTYAHDISIQLVEKKLVDGASIDGLILDFIKKNKPEKVKYIKVIQKSKYYGIPPVVVPANLNEDLKTKLRNILLNLHNDSIGAEMIKKLMIDRFIHVGDTLYNSLRYE